MASPSNMRAGLAKALLYSLLSFFLVPGITYGFASYVFEKMDTDYRVQIDKKLEAFPQQREAVKANSENYLPSKRCQLSESGSEQFCPRYSSLWQFHTAEVTAWWTMASGAGVFAMIFLLAGVAFLSSRAPTLSFLLGWRLLIAASALEVIVQGALAVWLSYWVTVYFFHVYVLKIIVVVAIMAISASIYAVIWIFKKVQPKNEVSGELLTEDREPRLWARVRALAERVRTAPPDYIIGGIDSNFFVTQAPLTLNGEQIAGRILFVSLPLLRVFDEAEADAVLSHELAHFRGGDTKWGSLLGPKLWQFDLYCRVMQLKKIFVAVYILRLYRIIFEFALKRSSRQREFIADRTAAGVISSQSLVQALIKFLGYSSYRNEVENQLLAHDQRHQGSLSIAEQVAAGLHPYAASSQFIDKVRLATIPHPFDSHPSLKERMKNVGFFVEERAFPAIITASPSRTWADSITSIDTVEAGLWRQYEENFAAHHERMLAYRLRPSNAEEEAIVLKYFPPVRFDLKGGKQVHITYAGIVLPVPVKGTRDALLPWREVAALTLKNSTFRGNRLVIGHPKTGALPVRSTTLSLSGLKNVAAFNGSLATYWRRHQIMVQSNQRAT